ncbi:MAG: hypothetical protein HY320_03400 [Armatimonadetes bacterium]|nr:hypothetical protein [Armatimonadota bacterium]
MSDPARDRGDLQVWQAHTLRMTAFPATPVPVGEHTWWTDTVGGDPDTRVVRRKSGEQTEEGPLGPGKMALRLTPGRVDWLLTPQDSTEESPVGFPVLGAYRDAADLFTPVVRRWLGLANTPDLQRIAFGTVLLRPVGTIEEGYGLLSSYLPSVQIDPERSRDLLYQINRPRPSTCGPTDLQINRLSKWSVAAVQMMRIPIAPLALPVQQGLAQLACRLELDVNTAADYRGPLDRQQMVPLFEEIVRLAEEIACCGDRP